MEAKRLEAHSPRAVPDPEAAAAERAPRASWCVCVQGDRGSVGAEARLVDGLIDQSRNP